MRHRAGREDIYRQVRKDTTEICEERKFHPEPVKREPSLELVSPSVQNTIKSLGMEFAREMEEVKETLELCESKEDYLLCVKHWMGRLAVGEREFNTHYYDIGGEGRALGSCEITTVRVARYRLQVTLRFGNLSVLLSKENKADPMKPLSHWTDERLLLLEGKPTRVLGKIFGEKFATHLSQNFPIKSADCELQLSRHYLPELYRIMAKDENHTSCMSKASDFYELPDTHHPVMAYEGSPNAALALIWDKKKGRHIARAIINLDTMTFSTSYGTSGADEMFIKAGLSCDGDMEGMLLHKKYYEGELLVPYVDGDTQKLSHSCHEFLKVDSYGDIEGNYETGREIEPAFYCPCCCNDMPESEAVYIEREDRQVCNGCVESDYVIVDEEYVHYEDTLYCDYACEHYIYDDHSCHEVRVYGHGWRNVIDDNLQDALRDWNITEVDGESVDEWLEEQAA